MSHDVIYEERNGNDSSLYYGDTLTICEKVLRM